MIGPYIKRGQPAYAWLQGCTVLPLHLLHDHGVEVGDELGALGGGVVPDQLADAGRARGQHDERGADGHGLLDGVADEQDGAARLSPDAADLLLHDAASRTLPLPCARRTAGAPSAAAAPATDWRNVRRPRTARPLTPSPWADA